MRKVIATLMAGALIATSVAVAPAAEARHRRHHHNNHGDAAAAAIIGLAVGAIIASQANNGYRTRTYTRTYYPPSYYNNGYYAGGYNGYSNGYANSHVQRCAMRYRSYDPYSDTFVGYDGRRYYCQL